MARDLEQNTIYEIVLVVGDDGLFHICVTDHETHKLVDVTSKLKQQFSEPH